MAKGFAFHVHHDTLAEWCYDYEGRVKEIRRAKPREEQELRLRLFKLIPDDHLPQELLKAGAACEKAGGALDNAREAYIEAKEARSKAEETYGEAWKARNRAWKAYDKAEEAYDKAREASNNAGEACNKAIKKHMPYLEELHKELCPGCPWDGETIFSKGG